MPKAPKKERISFQLPVVPHSLRAFVEKTVKDERMMLSFVESPESALRAAGIPIQLECLTRSDYDRLKLVLGKLRNLVADGKIAKDFRFEDVFSFAGLVAYQEQYSSTESYAYTNFDHSTDGQSSENRSSREGGIKNDFSKAGIRGLDVEEIVAPMLRAGDLAAIATLMQTNLDMLVTE